MCAQPVLSFHPMPKVYRCKGPKVLIDRIKTGGSDEIQIQFNFTTEDLRLSPRCALGHVHSRESRAYWLAHRRFLMRYRGRVYQARSAAKETLFYLSQAQPYYKKNTARTADPTQSTVVVRRHCQRTRMSSPDWELKEYLQIFRYGFSVSIRRDKRLRIRLHSETSKEPWLYLGITPICAKYATVLFFKSARYTVRDDQLSNPMKNANQREIRQKQWRRTFWHVGTTATYFVIETTIVYIYHRLPIVRHRRSTSHRQEQTSTTKREKCMKHRIYDD